MSINIAARERSCAVLTVERGMQVLRAFRSDRSLLTNAELVRRTGLSKATVSRLTSTLLQTGYLAHGTGRRGFQLGTASLGIGLSFLATSNPLATAQQIMQDLADEQELSVALGIRDGFDMLYIAERTSSKTATLRLQVGTLLPMGKTAIGHAYIWGLPEAERQPMIDALLKASGPKAAVTANSLEVSFAALASSGTCAVQDGFMHGTYGIALPIRVGHKKVVMALSCAKAGIYFNMAEEQRRIVPKLRQAATDLEKILADFDGYL
jgi:DNA-binding IclR family transcriptional regulator